MKVRTSMIVVATIVTAAVAQANMNTKSGKASGTTSDTTTGTSGSMHGTQSGMTTGSGQMELVEGLDYAVIEFPRGSSTLPAAHQSKIREMVSKLGGGKSASIEDVHVAVWSDKAFPKSGTELSKADQDLASKRAEAVQTFLEDTLTVSDVETYNMAERSNWFARALETSESELKSLFSQRGAPQTVEPREFQAIKKNGGPMKAVILIERSKEARNMGMDQGTMSGTTSDTMSGTTSGATSGTSKKSGAAKVPSSGPLDDPKTQSDDIR